MKYIIFVSAFFIHSAIFAQWECRSNLPGHLKPLYEGSNINWAGELIGSTGYLTNSSISSGMSFLGLDYSKNNHQFYFEGGIKYWNKYDYDFQFGNSQTRTGLRELSYTYFTPKLSLRLGLQQLKLPNYFLLNERAWGASLNKKAGNYEFNLIASSVTKDFARNGVFCTNAFLYDIVPSRNLPLGNKFGQTNLLALSIQKNIEKKSTKGQKSDAVNTDNEFDEFSEFESSDTKNSPFLKSYGVLFYSELGVYYYNPNTYFGVNGEFSLGKNASLNAQAIYQQVTDKQALLYSVQAEKKINYSSGNLTTIQLMYLGKYNIDDDALAVPRFSNLFFGEIFRMDAIDMPLINFSFKQQFVKSQLSLKLLYSQQLQALHMKELDFSVGKYFFNKHLRTTLLSGMMKSDETNEWSNLARFEARIFF